MGCYTKSYMIRHFAPRPYTPHVHLRARLRRLEAELLACWREWEGCGWPGWNTEAGVAYVMRLHDLRAALYQTLQAVEAHKKRARGVVK